MPDPIARGLRDLVLVALLSGAVSAQDPVAAEDPPEGIDQAEEMEGLDEGLEELEGLQDLEGFDEGEGLGGSSILRRFRGSLETELRVFLRDRDRGARDEQWVQSGELELDFALGKDWYALARPRFRVDVLDGDRDRFDPLEAWLEIRKETWDLRAGQMLESWGIADTSNPVDVLNRQDLDSDFLDPDRLGEFGIRLRGLFEGGSLIGEPMLAVYFVPVWQATPFPSQKSRWSFSQAGPVFEEDVASTPHGKDRLFAALHATSTLNTGLANADLQILVAHGPGRIPLPLPLAGSGGSRIAPVYHGETTIGGGLRAVPNAEGWSDWTIKAELVHRDPFRFSDSSLLQDPDAYLTWAVGVDRLFPTLFSDRDQLTLTLEHVGETGASDLAHRFRPFHDNLVGRAFWEAQDFSRTSLELRGLFSLRSDQVLLELVFERQLRFVHEDLGLAVAWQQFLLDRSVENLFNAFPNNSNLRFGLRLDF